MQGDQCCSLKNTFSERVSTSYPGRYIAVYRESKRVQDNVHFRLFGSLLSGSSGDSNLPKISTSTKGAFVCLDKCQCEPGNHTRP